MRKRLVAPVLAVALLAAACGDDGDDGGGSAAATSAGGAPASTVAKQPKSGGTITMSTFIETTGLDPLVSSGNGVTGGIEMAAIYDTVMRWVPETGRYEPRTAESLVANADSTEWTLKIKPGIKFTDGTDYNAEAVKASLDRHKSAANRTASSGYMGLVKTITVSDPLTLKITTDAWPGFPSVLSDEPGMVPSPTALAQCGTTPPAQCAFNLKPVGAGPFVIESFTAKESIVMKKNPNYHGGTVYLDGLKFVNLGDGGAEKSFDALKTGTTNVAFLRSPQAIDRARKDGYKGYTALIYAGATTLMNLGRTVTCTGGNPAPVCTGKPDGPTVTDPPTKNLKVRKAIQAALDPKIFNDRVYDGLGLPGNELYQKGAAFDPGIPGPKVDLAEARRLVTEAKAEGWDGKVRYICLSSPAGQAQGATVKALLESVGMSVDADTSKPSQITDVINANFDLACWGLPFAADDLAFGSMNQNFLSTSAGNRTAWRNTTVDGAVAAFRQAKTNDEKKAAIKTITEEYIKDAPFVVNGAVEEFIAWDKKVQGIVPNNATVVYFDKAWIDS
jgi:peptide/nickel transport system substrate-binding protein